MKKIIKKLCLGKIIYNLYFKPLARIREIRRIGGFLEARRIRLGQREMEMAALKLIPNTDLDEKKPLILYTLTGNKFWYQTAFALWTFEKHSGIRVAAVIHDDGSLTKEQASVLANLFPLSSIVNYKNNLEKLERLLPRNKYPYLRDRWDNYPIIRKIIATHLGSSGWKLIIDSDLLFFRRPQFLIDWMDNPAIPLHAVDTGSYYGYSRTLLNSVSDHPVSDRINAGLYGLKSEEIDWEKLELKLQKLFKAESHQYYLEQAVLAILVAGRNPAIAPEIDYITLPSEKEALTPQAVMHHFVDYSKKWYFKHSWRYAVNKSQ